MARSRKPTDKRPTGKRLIEQYDHKGKQRKNNPPVGLVTEATDRDEIHRFDYSNTKTGQIESGDTRRIVMWMLGPADDGRSLLPRQVFFPMADESGGWARLARNLKAEIDEECIQMESRLRIPVPRDRIADFCRRHHIRRLAFFGSVLRDDFTPDSDVDVLVEFEPGNVPGFAFFHMEDELSEILGRRVDLNTPNSLSKYFRNEVLAEAEELYDQAR
ncbi:MAG: nucleotidyltransferase family protein [Candidatus Rokuibacteriota bacterium]